MNQMRVVSGRGHDTMTWEPPSSTEHDPAAVSDVKAEFDRLIAANYAAFDVGIAGRDDRRLEEFDPEAKSITVVAPLAGG